MYYYIRDNFEIHHGHCLDVLSGFEDNAFDSVITDPPYALQFMGKGWDKVIPGVEFWRETLRTSKPGAIQLAFGGTRTHHRLMCAIEDAGWLIRDVIMWVYGSGFPKSHNISKAIDKAAGVEREVMGYNNPSSSRTAMARSTTYSGFDDSEKNKGVSVTAPTTQAAKLWDGWGTALKPAWEPIIVAMKPLDGTFAQNAQKWGVAGLWVDGGRVACEGGSPSAAIREAERKRGQSPSKPGCYDRPLQDRTTHETRTTARLGEQLGRFPANLIHDGSDEVTGLFPVTKSSKSGAVSRSGGVLKYGGENSRPSHGITRNTTDEGYDDQGSAARFFYCAKASRKERGEGNNHPTVKPLALMRYLCKLTKTPTGGSVLDLFMGSGTTGLAAILEGRSFVGIDDDLSSCEIARSRFESLKSDARQLELDV